jgi:hypothetical protein
MEALVAGVLMIHPHSIDEFSYPSPIVSSFQKSMSGRCGKSCGGLQWRLERRRLCFGWVWVWV